MTRGAQATGGDVDVAEAPLLGLARVVPLERPELRCARIDLDPDRPEGEVAALVRELLADGPEEEVALRGSRRLVARLSTAPATPRRSAHVAPRPDRSYLVTGGLGALGLATAQWLAEQGAGRLVLVGRTGATAERRRAVEALRARAEVEVHAADVGSRDALARILAAVPADRPLAGVFHAAGALDDALLADQGPEHLRRAFAAKVRGAWHLHHLLGERPLDAFVLYGSVAGLIGSVGQANYAAANAFLAALAHHRTATGRPTLCVDFGPVSGGGMARAGHRLAARGARSLTPTQVLSALARALRDGEAQAGVVDLDPAAWLAAHPASAGSPRLGAMLPAAPVSAPAWRDQLAALPADARTGAAEGLLRGELAPILRCDAAEIADRPFLELGLDSLTSVELRSRLVARTGLALPVTVLWTHTTPRALAAALVAELGLAPVAAPRAPEPPPDDVDALMDLHLARLEALVPDPTEVIR
ncbi:MAG: beta-ketoacyl reductase [Myxococcota bacterium]